MTLFKHSKMISGIIVGIVAIFACSILFYLFIIYTPMRQIESEVKIIDDYAARFYVSRGLEAPSGVGNAIP
jgi:hypothetical protein